MVARARHRRRQEGLRLVRPRRPLLPTRVDAKCRLAPSLAVAHHCLWRYHPSRAYAWELRLQDELRPDFLLSDPDAAALRAKEDLRRSRKSKDAQPDLPLDDEDDGSSERADLA
ncbi:MAG: hypothetical protein KBD62_00640 [Kofleriaceae bacterium]|nr:hypothetical protein [Kofleriaceae bacterium]